MAHAQQLRLPPNHSRGSPSPLIRWQQGYPPHLSSTALPEGAPKHGHHEVTACEQKGLVCWHRAIINQEHHICGGGGDTRTQKGGQSWGGGCLWERLSSLPAPLCYLQRSLCSGTP